MEDELESAPSRRDGVRLFVARVETFYLSALRIMLLLLATILVLVAIWFGVSGLYKVSRSASAVVVANSTVTANEVADIVIPADVDAAPGQPADPFKAERAYYKQFVDRYFALFEQKYQPFRQNDDPRLDRAGFDERFVKSADRLAALGRGEVVFDADKADLETLYATMKEAATLPATVDRLKRYRAATKTKVSRVIRGTRSEQYCSYYGYYINECITYSTRDVPYERTVTDLKLPKGVMAPVDLLHAYQDRHFDLLRERRKDASDKAEGERFDITVGNVVGGQRLWMAVSLVGGFLGVMLVFLLIAIERHQRRLAAAAPSALAEES